MAIWRCSFYVPKDDEDQLLCQNQQKVNIRLLKIKTINKTEAASDIFFHCLPCINDNDNEIKKIFIGTCQNIKIIFSL